MAGIIPLLDRLFSLRRLLALLTPPGWLRPYRGATCEELEELVDRRLAGAIHMRRRACLRKGLTLFHFMRLAGHDAVLHFAVYPPGDEESPMRGHCWITSDGKDYGEKPDRAHVTVMRYGE